MVKNLYKPYGCNRKYNRKYNKLITNKLDVKNSNLKRS